MALLRTAVVLITCGLVHSASFDLSKATTFAGWSAAAYCDSLQNWECGAQCRRNPQNRLVNITVVQVELPLCVAGCAPACPDRLLTLYTRISAVPM